MFFGLCGVPFSSCRRCHKTSKSVKNQIETFYQDGINRTYHVRLPPDFIKDVPAPLVIALHGGKGDGRGFDRNTTAGTLTAAGAVRGVLLVFPEGINKQWCDGRTEMLKEKETT